MYYKEERKEKKFEIQKRNKIDAFASVAVTRTSAKARHAKKTPSSEFLERSRIFWNIPKCLIFPDHPSSHMNIGQVWRLRARALRREKVSGCVPGENSDAPFSLFFFFLFLVFFLSFFVLCLFFFSLCLYIFFLFTFLFSFLFFVFC